MGVELFLRIYFGEPLVPLRTVQSRHVKHRAALRAAQRERPEQRAWSAGREWAAWSEWRVLEESGSRERRGEKEPGGGNSTEGGEYLERAARERGSCAEGETGVEGGENREKAAWRAVRGERPALRAAHTRRELSRGRHRGLSCTSSSSIKVDLH